jgi:hypothetical protein
VSGATGCCLQQVTQGGGWHCIVHAQWQERSEAATWQAQVMHKARASWALQ